MKIERLRPTATVSSFVNSTINKIKYETLNFITSTNLSITGNGTDSVSIFKTSGSFTWDNHAYTSQSFTAPVTLEFTKNAGYVDNGRSYAMISFNTDPTTNVSYDTLDYAAYPHKQNGYYVYNNGAGIDVGGQWWPEQRFYIVYGVDGTIKHYNGSKLLYNVSYAAGQTVYVDSSFHSPSYQFGGFSNIRVTKNEWMVTPGYGYNTSYIPANGQLLYLDSLNHVNIPSTTPMRYIRFYANGSTANTSTHFVELQALTSGGTNRLLNVGSTGGLTQYTGGAKEFTDNTTNWQILTNGVTTSTDYIGFGSGGGGIQADLGAIYSDISSVVFWNYYADGRTYTSCQVQISTDGTNWTTIYGPTNTATTSTGVSTTTSTTLWKDLSGNNNHFTLAGTLTHDPIEGFSGFTQANRWFRNSFPGKLKTSNSGGTGYTTIVWAKQTAKTALWNKIIGNNDAENYIDLYLSPTNGYYHQEDGSTLSYNNNTSVANDAFAGGNTWRMYVSTNQNGGTTTVPSGAFGVGGAGDGSANHPFNGNIATVMIYNRILAPMEISAIFENTRARFGV